MVLVHKDMHISTLEDILKLKVKDLREILRSNSKTMDGVKADLVFKVYAILMQNVLRSAENINSKMPMMALTITRIQRKIEATSSMKKF